MADYIMQNDVSDETTIIDSGIGITMNKPNSNDNHVPNEINVNTNEHQVLIEINPESNDNQVSAEINPDSIDSQVSAEINPDFNDNQVSAEINPDSIDSQVSSEINPDSNDNQVSAEINPDSIDSQVSAEINPDSNDNQVSAEINLDSIDSQVSTEINPDSNDNQVSAEINPDSNDNQVSTEINPDSIDSQVSAEIYPDSNDNQVSAEINPNLTANQVSIELNYVSNDNQVSAEISTVSDDNQVSAEINPDSNDNQVSTEINPDSIDSQVSAEIYPDSNDNQVSTEISTVSNDNQVSTEISIVSNDNQVSSEINFVSDDNQVSAEISTISNDNQVSTEINFVSDDNQVSAEINPDSNDYPMAVEINPNLTANQVSIEINYVSNDNQVSAEISTVSDDSQVSAEINPDSNDNQIAVEINPNSTNNQVSTDVTNSYDAELLLPHTSIPNFKQEQLNSEVLHSLVDKCPSPSIERHKIYSIGDIVWAKIGKYPFWPSIVCYDPKSKSFLKGSIEDNKFSLHVRFCNDKGRRSWSRTVENYSGKQDLLMKFPSCLSYINSKKRVLNTWNLAIEEADTLLKLDGDARMMVFFSTFSNSDSLDCSYATLNNHPENNTTVTAVRTYARKRSLTVSEQDINPKIIKTENISVDGSISSRSIDIPLLTRSDDADSTVSDISMRFIEDTGLKTRKFTKTYPPKSSLVEKYDLSDSLGTFSESNDDNSLLLDVHNQPSSSTSTTTVNVQTISKQTKLETSALEDDIENNLTTYSRQSFKKYPKRAKLDKNGFSNNNDQDTSSTIHSQSPSNFTKTLVRRKINGQVARRKSTTVKCESSPEPDTTESETSSKNDLFSSFFTASKKNKQLFVKITKRVCVVCKNYNDTIKCMGSCQSFFHKECFAKSEERYHKNDPMIKFKKMTGKRTKRHYSKSRKHKNLNLNVSTIIESISVKLCNPDDGFVTVSNVKSPLDDTIKEDTLHDQPKSDDLSINIKCISSENDNIQQFNELENVNEDSIHELPGKKIVDMPNTSNSILLTNEQVFTSESKNICSLCEANRTICFVCGLDIVDSEQKLVCKLSSCGKYYHEKCLEEWPQCQWNQGSRNNVRTVICPHHVCHLCISDNPKSACKTHFPAEKLIRCIKCPTAYHRSEYCLPAGSQILTYYDIVCSRHFEPSKTQNYHYNATWCFICTLGGALVCCDLCPSSFHVECLNQNISDFVNGFTCEECQTGRYPLYGEIVWVKIGNYRWWPAKVIFPDQVPDTVNAIVHSIGEFAVQFFGTFDYYWVNRGRVFNFHEGDDENILVKSKMKSIDQVFQDAVIEAAQAHNGYVLNKDKNDAILAKKSFTKPPKFVRIKLNKPFGNVKITDVGTNNMTPCECDPYLQNPCGPGSDCINRMLMFECHPQLCPAGDKCNNQRFEKRLYPRMVPFLTKDKGWGLKTLDDIKEGSFVIEYVGDVIDEEEFQKRCLEMHRRNEQNYYFLTIDNSRMIDAGPKGNLSRFMNHSCEPNCVTQKWIVNGDTRIGLFALNDISSGTELVFDYRLQSCSGVEKKPCQCGAARCSRFIGVKVEEDKKKVIPINDTDKCRSSTKNKRRPLKLKDNVSDSDKPKFSRVINNNQNISTEKETNGVTMNTSINEKINDSRKSPKTRLFGRSPSAFLKNENVDITEKHNVHYKKLKNSSRNTTNMTKKNAAKPNLSSLLKNVTKLTTATTTTLTDKKNYVAGLENIEDMKTIINSKEDLTKTEQIHEVLKNAREIKTDNYEGTQEGSRHSLTRLAKSRHSFLSKKDTKKETIQPIVVHKQQCNTNEKKNMAKITKTNSSEIPSEKTIIIKNNKVNKCRLLSKTYHKNDSCMICGQRNAELKCKNKKCPRVFHLSCMNKTRIVKSGFICPSHFCSKCNKRKVVAKCKLCVESFCFAHVKGNIFNDPLGNGMLCTTHHPNKKSLPIKSTLNTSSVTHKVTNSTKTDEETINFSESSQDILMANILPDNTEDQLNNDTDEIEEEEKYTFTQVIKDECDRQYIHIGGFNVCNMSDLVTDQGMSCIAPIDTDGDLFKPSSAEVVIDIESASALYQPTDSLQLVSIDTENKDNHDYANVHFVPDTNQTKSKWLTAEP